MATILLSAAGAAIGGSIGGSVLGLSMAAVGRFAGGVVGRSLDQRLLGQGSEVVDSGRVDRLRITGAGEGEAIAQVFGRMRIAGQVIWASEFTEEVTVTGGGKGAPSRPTTRNYSYSVSLAIALCAGEITHVGRVWADGNEIAPDSLTMRVYRGTADQLPDPKMETIEGAGAVPAYRGTADVVIEDLDMGRFGNRIPQFTFEVTRPAPKAQPGAELDPAHAVTGVALLPGSGEYTLATTPVTMDFGPGSSSVANVNTPSEKTDLATSLDSLTGELPNCGATSLIVSWFGNDLRCGDCTIRPKVEQSAHDGREMPWQVAGLSRAAAQQVAPDEQGRPIYGGTSADAAVIEAIEALKAAGQDVMYYPFILMDQTAGNTLPDPYTGETGQPVLPWRGRITLSAAPGQPASPDGTAAAVAEVAAFFGTASAADFAIDTGTQTGFDPLQPVGQSPGESGGLPFDQPVPAANLSPVTYTGPDEWSFRRYILHQAALCAAAGGVESFCIGSEMRGLTQIRGPGNSFPAVAQLIDLAAEVRALLGPDVKISYAADWSEYWGYQPADGSGDRFFHLDPLWADAEIDFIGIDNYMPLSDWRDGQDHLDAHWGSIYDLDHLQANIEGGEGYDWYYHSSEARAAQIRTPITDGAYNEPWVWRYKDIRNWWSNVHRDRVGGVRRETPTPWIPESKPIRFTEFGCPAVDKGTNQPNKFLDPKSSESFLPHHSAGYRDELIQMQYLRAVMGYWRDPAHNPVSEEYGGRMLDMDHAYVWAWDARPYPFFPNRRDIWSDAANYARGHWITGRVSAYRLASLVEEICTTAGLAHCDTDGLHGYVRGYAVQHVGEARAALQPLMLAYGVDALDREGALRFRQRDGLSDGVIDREHVILDPETGSAIEEIRGSAAEDAGRVRLRFFEADADFEVIAEETVLPEDETHSVATTEVPLSLTRAEGRTTVERWLSEGEVAADGLRLTLPPSRLDLGAGDVVSLDEAGGPGHFRIDRVEQQGGAQKLEAVRIEPESYRPVAFLDEIARQPRYEAPVPVLPIFLDLPLMTGDEVPHAPHLAVTARPWPGRTALYSAPSDANYALNRLVEARARIGVTLSPLPPGRAGLPDRGPALEVEMIAGQLASVDDPALLGGANLCAIGDGSPGGWELMQFRDATMTAERTWALTQRLRGQLGTEVAVPDDGWPAGSYLVMMDGVPDQIGLTDAQRGQLRHYRVGPADRPYTDPAYRHAAVAFEGIGLRPLSPVHLRAREDPGGDTEVTWIRRTRIDGDRWDTPEVPLGEEREEYRVRVVNNGAVVREETVHAPTWTYAAADRVDDGLGGLFDIEVAQVSARFGPGAVARITLGV
ncbi:baseplate multidomain protein megatron [Roseovarius salinarum]|uniref:baseplate multidomain protein megatron n=1 Tax=Roseovarius salinarum TaxID=1981892 RepID=UPI000C349B3A|nr:glycoside hydrolase/phage tail family protein [Roseovarius salinarum]